MEPTAYKTLFFGELKQLTDLSIGGTDLISDVDMPMALDGKQRPVLKGTSLAGALLYTLRKLGHKIPPELAIDTEFEGEYFKQNKTKNTLNKRPVLESLWSINNAYLQSNSEPDYQLRQYVKIDPASGAAENGSLFDMQVVCAPNTWFLWIEVDTYAYERLNHRFKDQFPLSPEDLIAIALLNWQKEGVMLGRRSVAGTGWFTLNTLNTLRLNTRAFELWPNNLLQKRIATENAKPLKELEDQDGVTLIESAILEQEITARLKDFDASDLASASFQGVLPTHKPFLHTPLRAEYHITLTAGPRKDEQGNEWGLDGFMIGGHEAMDLDATMNFSKSINDKNKWQEQFHWPNDYPCDVNSDTSTDLPDNFFVYDINKDPFIPGSSLRGILHHQIRRHTSHEADQDTILSALFGSTDQSSRLFIKDATLKEKGNWKGLIFHNHAEDDFTAGPYESSKFVRCSIVDGCFHGEIVLEADDLETFKQQKQWLESALELGTHNQLAIGSKQWVDSGWLKWEYTTVNNTEQQGG